MAYRIEKYGSRFFAVYDQNNSLICVTVYRRGATEVVRRLQEAVATNVSDTLTPHP